MSNVSFFIYLLDHYTPFYKTFFLYLTSLKVIPVMHICVLYTELFPFQSVYTDLFLLKMYTHRKKIISDYFSVDLLDY